MFQSIPSVQVTLPAVVAQTTVATRVWVLTLPDPPFDPEAYDALVAAYEARGKGCKWSAGHPGDLDFKFCGGPVSGHRHYCAEHAARSRYRGKRRLDGGCQ